MSLSRIAIFVGIVSLLTAIIHRYLWMRLVRDPMLPLPWARITTWALIVLGFCIPLALMLGRIVPRTFIAPFTWIAFLWLGVMFYLLVFLLPLELVRSGVRLFSRWLGMRQGEADLPRRLFMSRLLGGVAAISAAFVSGAGVVAVASGIKIVKVRVPLRKLHPKLSGFRIVQMTDIHVGPMIGRDFVLEIVRQANELNADVIAITGDLVDGSVDELRHLVAPLSDLRARHGVFFVTGNHEYYSGATDWVKHLPSLGMRVLRNECVTVEQGGACVDIAGVDDWTASEFDDGHGADLTRALSGRNMEQPVVLLAHQPKAVHEASRAGVDLQISGHTHGGQIVPFNLLARLAQPAIAGLHRFAETHLYVSRGTGYWGPPMRVGAEAEITLIELVHDQPLAADPAERGEILEPKHTRTEGGRA